LRNYWWHLSPAPDPFMAAFAFLAALPRDEAAAALRNRAMQLEAGVKQLEAALSADWLDDKPTYVAWMWELTMARSQAEIEWCGRIAARVESGVPYLPSKSE
jgi:hypothetical protein